MEVAEKTNLKTESRLSKVHYAEDIFPSSTSSGFFSSESCCDSNVQISNLISNNNASENKRRHSWPFQLQPVVIAREGYQCAATSVSSTNKLEVHSFFPLKDYNEDHVGSRVSQATDDTFFSDSEENEKSTNVRNVSFDPELFVYDSNPENPSCGSETSKASSVGSYVTTFLIPPEGDWGWIVTFAAFIIFCLTSGLIRCYGVIFDEERTRNGLFCYTTAYCVLFISVPISELMSDAVRPRKTAVFGTIIFTGSLFISYLSTNDFSYIFTLGVLPGLGISLCFVSTNRILSQYFFKKRRLAMVLGFTGSAVGTITWPLLLQYGFENIGFQWSWFTLAWIVFISVICASFYKPAIKFYRRVHIKHDLPEDLDTENNENDANRLNEEVVHSSRRNSSFDKFISAYNSLKNLPKFAFLLAIIGMTVANISIILALFTLPGYMKELAYSKNVISFFVMFIGAGDLVGRLVCSKLDRNNKKAVYLCILPTVLAGIAIVIIAYNGSSFAVMVALVSVFGFASSCESPWSSRFLDYIFGQVGQVEKGCKKTISCLIHITQGIIIVAIVGLLDYLLYNSKNRLKSSLCVMGSLIILSCFLLWISAKLVSRSTNKTAD